MNKRGISPIISTVLLICMVVLIAVVILAWSGTFTRGLLKHADETSEKMTACESQTNLDIRSACTRDDTITVMVESLGSKKSHRADNKGSWNLRRVPERC